MVRRRAPITPSNRVVDEAERVAATAPMDKMSIVIDLRLIVHDGRRINAVYTSPTRRLRPAARLSNAARQFLRPW